MDNKVSLQANDGQKTGQNHRFNDDLLIANEDSEEAERLYPTVIYALNHPDLKSWLSRIDPKANDAKKRGRRWGYWAVILVSAALMGASAEPLYLGHHGVAIWIACISALLGIFGAIVGWFGVLFARNKKTWLLQRLMTEQMRLFHFRTLLSLSDLILSGQEDNYKRERDKRFEAFEADVLRRPDLVLDTIRDPERDGDDLTVVIPAPPAALDTEIVADFFAAYRRLRIQRQVDYAQYKLGRDRKVFSAFPRQQAAWLEGTALACVAGLVLVHLSVIAAVLFDWAALSGPWLGVIAIWLAIAALALRTLQEGLQPKQEVERYRHYRATVRAAMQRFDAASTPEEKLAVAKSVERASADEMLIFLRSSAEARFVM
jgi:hypothetical protein